jgi:hypothetical protein
MRANDVVRTSRGKPRKAASTSVPVDGLSKQGLCVRERLNSRSIE